MRTWQLATTLSLVVLTLTACDALSVERNAFLGYAEEYGLASGAPPVQEGAAGGSGAQDVFRQSLTVRFANLHAGAILDTSFVAWIDVSSVRSASQQDALLRSGYVQLTREVRLGSVYTLPVGTFVYNGPGTAGATPITLGPATGGEDADDDGDDDEDASPEAAGVGTPTEVSFTLVTPDVLLVFKQPPVSCDSVAFTYSNPVTGEVISGPNTMLGGYKTLAQIDVYTCSPFAPGLFFSAAGGEQENNEFREGEPITFGFNPGSLADGSFAQVYIGATVDFQPEEE